MLVSQLERLILALEGRLPSMPTLCAEKIHTLLISTKDFRPLLDVPALREAAKKCDQVCVNLTITGFGGTLLEPRVPAMELLFARIGELDDYYYLHSNDSNMLYVHDPLQS